MNNPVCLVSGSSSGIGSAIVRRFAAQGYDVTVHYNSGKDPSDPRSHKKPGAELATVIADEIHQEHGVEAIALGADLGQPEAAFDLVDRTHEHFGRLDTVVSNSGVTNFVVDEAGKAVRYRFHETPIKHLAKEMDRVLSINLMGAYRLCQRSLKLMMDQAEQDRQRGEQPRHRSILFVGSISDVAPDSMRIPYGVSKAGLNHAVQGAAFEGGPHNITVNALRPGVVETPLTSRPSGVFDPDSGAEYTVAETYGVMAEGGAQPIPRIGHAEDIACAAHAFTQIPYMTGQLIAVDGGFTLVNGFANRELFLKEGMRRRQERGRTSR
ncbi:MAG TPA: SDR family oxidoreductase [Candidatus Latescibacteria bacterium]|nr:SDR family oxidoreductase [Candidatus Latescibacterota bacterium]